MILVTGATGTVGRDVVDALVRRGGPAGGVRAGSRSGRPVGGAPGVALDFDDPSTWADALAGVTSVFLVRPPAMSRVAPLLSFVDAAVAAGVRRIVFLSLLGAEGNAFLPHRRVEKHLETCAGAPAGATSRGAHGVATPDPGLEAVFLRAGFFMQNLIGPHRPDIADLDEIVVPAGAGRTSFVDTRDVAEAAARLLAGPGAARGVTAYDLTGAQALTYHEVADVLTDVLGRRIEYREPSLLRFIRVMRGRGHPWPYLLVMAGIYTTTRLGMAERVSADLPRLLGRPPTPFLRFAADHRELWHG